MVRGKKPRTSTLPTAQSMGQATKSCPFCGEGIPALAIKGKHWGSSLAANRQLEEAEKVTRDRNALT
jgi:hypothetical protein